MGILFAIALSLPAGDLHDFDEANEPPVVLSDSSNFHDAILALKHGSNCRLIWRLIVALESRWWDTAGFEHEYRLELRRLYLAYTCWDRLERGCDVSCGSEYRLRYLRELRRLIGPIAYQTGRLPDFPTDALGYLGVPEVAELDQP